MGKNNEALLIGAATIAGIFLLSKNQSGAQGPLTLFGGEGAGVDTSGLMSGISDIFSKALDAVKGGAQGAVAGALGIDDVTKAIKDALAGFGGGNGGGGDGTTPGSGDTTPGGGGTTQTNPWDVLNNFIKTLQNAGPITKDVGIGLKDVAISGAIGAGSFLALRYGGNLIGPTTKAIGSGISGVTKFFAGKQSGEVAVRALAPAISTTTLLSAGVAAEILGLTQLRGENPSEVNLQRAASSNPTYVAQRASNATNLGYYAWLKTQQYAPYSMSIKENVPVKKTANKYYVEGKMVYGGAR